MSDHDPIYRELQKQLDKLPIGFPATDSGVELELLEYFFTPREAMIALCLTLRSISVAAVRKRLRKDHGLEIPHDELGGMLDAMFMKGTVSRSGTKERPGYSAAMLALGMFEYHVDDLTPALVDMMHRYFEEGFNDEFFRSSMPQLRTSPHYQAVAEGYRIDTFDNMRQYVMKTRETIFVANCVCKQGEDLVGKPCSRTKNIEVCLLFGSQSYPARDRAREITRQECLALIDRAEAEGLVLQPSNTRKPFCLCLCCGCCCGVMTAAKQYPRPAELFASNYRAIIDDTCKACGLCLKRCPMDAIVVEGKTYRVDHDRCIGCGLCVTRCPAKSARLEKKSRVTVPSAGTALLYLSILKEKVGKRKMMLAMLRLLLGKPL